MRTACLLVAVIGLGCAAFSHSSVPGYDRALAAALKDPRSSDALVACRDAWDSEPTRSKRRLVMESLERLGYGTGKVTVFEEWGRADMGAYAYAVVIDGVAYSGLTQGRPQGTPVEGSELASVLRHIASGYVLTGDERRAASVQDGDCAFITVRVGRRRQEVAFYDYGHTGQEKDNLEQRLVISLGRFLDFK